MLLSRAMLLGRGALAALLVLSFANCTLLTGAGDLEVESGAEAETEGGAPEASPTVTDGVDGGSEALVDASDSSDGGLVGDLDASIVDGCSSTGCFDMPPGFSLVALGTKGAACPSGFGQPADTVEAPTVGPSACTCGCTVTTQPTCPSTGMIKAYYTGGGTAGTCPNAGGDMVNAGCGTDGYLGPFDTGNEHRYTPPPRTGGACQGTATKDDSKLSFGAEGRLCQATTLPQCDAKVCAPTVGGPFGVCIAANGDVACPGEFPKKRLVGTSASFTCSTTCTCSGVTATCKGRLDFYASANCTGAVGLSAPVNDQCVPTVAAGASFSSHRYVPDAPTNVACNKGGSSSPSAPTLGQTTTVCCK